MNVLWTKGKFHKVFSSGNSNLHASGDGAAAGRCCRLCGGDTCLRAFADTYVWEGVHERYDQLLYDCFGVRVTPSDCLICEWCVRQLRCTERFRALVHAAFDKPPSSSNHSVSSTVLLPKRQRSDEDKSIDNKNIIELLKTKMAPEKKPRRTCERKVTMNSSNTVRRTNIQCKVCKQKYPMILKCSGGKDFVCSRCKKNSTCSSICKRCNAELPHTMMKDHMGLHAKADLRGNNRQLSMTSKASQAKRQQEGSIRSRNGGKFKCSVCPKKYATAEHLVEHAKCEHDKNLCPFCKKELKTKELLDKHIQMHVDHSSLNYFSACPTSLKLCKSKREGRTRGCAREKRSV